MHSGVATTLRDSPPTRIDRQPAPLAIYPSDDTMPSGSAVPEVSQVRRSQVHPRDAFRRNLLGLPTTSQSRLDPPYETPKNRARTIASDGGKSRVTPTPPSPSSLVPNPEHRRLVTIHSGVATTLRDSPPTRIAPPTGTPQIYTARPARHLHIPTTREASILSQASHPSLDRVSPAP